MADRAIKALNHKRNDSGIDLTAAAATALTTAANPTNPTTNTAPNIFASTTTGTEIMATLLAMRQALFARKIAPHKQLEAYRRLHDRSWNHMRGSERERLSDLHQEYLDAQVLYTTFCERLSLFMDEVGYQGDEKVEKGKGGMYKIARAVKGQWRRTMLGMRKRGMLEVFFGPINGLLMEGVEAGEVDTAVVTAGCVKVEQVGDEVKV